MIKRKVTSKMLKENPYEKWNQFIDILAIEEYCDLTEIQRVAHLCFIYDSELQNGGHMQYFINRGTTFATETAQALKKLGAKEQSELFSSALNILKEKNISNIETIEDYLDEAANEKFTELDYTYYDIEPTINDYLEKYLEENESEFIVKEAN
ncbi:DMP19 family protein [Metabacillus malikii]|uniref:DNA mimic protein DMP19 C-terminal domain-containing protein n=1 Tax=Metabacillus malikii TaxID=1504265 RepID=A0ABT9ZD27_9BACI|nr:DUF4375 domain-containing protein [Metabacillus malikii]MDQ0230153.1 hypothetical protein [Metabacillus malikii]